MWQRISEWFVAEREANEPLQWGDSASSVSAGGDNPRSSCSADDVRPRTVFGDVEPREGVAREGVSRLGHTSTSGLAITTGDSVQQQSAATGKDRALCALVSKGVEARDVNDVP